MNPLDNIQNNYESFTKTEQKIAVYILNNPKLFSRSSIEANVVAIDTSKAALIRFSKKLGYTGYVEMKFDFSRYLISHSFTSDQDETDSNPIESLLKTYSDTILEITNSVNLETLQNISSNIKSAKRVKVIGLDHTGLSAKQLELRCLRAGEIVDAVVESFPARNVSEIMGQGDYCILLTTKDNTKLFSSIVESLHANQCQIALVTMANNLPYLALCNDVVILPSTAHGYGKFVDDQAIMFVFIELLMSVLTRENSH